jgi:hypothetical protein
MKAIVKTEDIVYSLIPIDDEVLVVLPNSDTNNDFRTEISVGENTIEITKYKNNTMRRVTYKISELLTPGIDDRGSLSVNPCDFDGVFDHYCQDKMAHFKEIVSNIADQESNF